MVALFSTLPSKFTVLSEPTGKQTPATTGSLWTDGGIVGKKDRKG